METALLALTRGKQALLDAVDLPRVDIYRITRAALVRALRRYADQLDEQASRLDGLLDSKAALSRRQAQGLRKQAAKLEQETDHGR